MENGQGERRGGRAQLKQIAKGEHESKIARAAVMLAYLALGLTALYRRSDKTTQR